MRDIRVLPFSSSALGEGFSARYSFKEQIPTSGSPWLGASVQISHTASPCAAVDSNPSSTQSRAALWALDKDGIAFLEDEPGTQSSSTSSSPYMSSSLCSSFALFLVLAPARASSCALSSSIFCVRKVLISLCIFETLRRVADIKAVLSSTESVVGAGGRANANVFVDVGEV